MRYYFRMYFDKYENRYYPCDYGFGRKPKIDVDVDSCQISKYWWFAYGQEYFMVKA